MKVYIISRGEKSEGSNIVDIFNERKKAVECALAQQTHFEGGWVKIDDNYYENGCDFVSVQRFKMKRKKKE